MTQNKYNKTSDATVIAAKKSAASNKQQGQTKEQTKLIELGIQRGIADYKKQQKFKARDADKAKKQKQRQLEAQRLLDEIDSMPSVIPRRLPWGLLILSWLCFVCYLLIK